MPDVWLSSFLIKFFEDFVSISLVMGDIYVIFYAKPSYAGLLNMSAFGLLIFRELEGGVL